MASNTSWGIEIGAFALKAIKLERDGDDVRVVEHAIVPHRKVLSDPEVDPNDVMRVSLGTFAANVDLSGATVVVSMPGHAGLTRFTKLPPVEKKRVGEIVKFEAAQQIPFPLDQVEWDYQAFTHEDQPDVEVGIFAITKEKIERQLDQLDEVGITPDGIVLSPVCVYNALVFDLGMTPSSPGTIFLDIGTTSTDLIICEGGGVWVRSFPLGGHNFTEALVDAFKLSYAKAEKLKREAEQSKHARHAMQAMRPVFADLIQDVQRSIGYYQGIHQGAELKRLVGLGSTFKLPGLRRFLKQQLQMDVYRLERFKRLSVEGAQGGEFEQATMNLATAYGLALQGVGLNTVTANLMPVARTRASMWKKKTKWFASAAALGLLAGGAAFIQPFMTSSAIAGVSEPPEINQAMNRFRQLQGTVPEAPSQDFTAANMVALAKPQDVYVAVLADIDAMLSDADQRAGAGADNPVFTLASMRTEYAPPNAENARPLIEDEPEDTRRLHVELTLRTDRANPERIVPDTLDRWLEENQRRDGLGYYLMYDPDQFFDVGGAGGARGGRGAPNTPPPPPPSGGGGGPRGGLDELAPITGRRAPAESAVVNVRYVVVLEPPPSEDGGEDE